MNRDQSEYGMYSRDQHTEYGVMPDGRHVRRIVWHDASGKCMTTSWDLVGGPQAELRPQTPTRARPPIPPAPQRAQQCNWHALDRRLSGMLAAAISLAVLAWVLVAARRGGRRSAE